MLSIRPSPRTTRRCCELPFNLSRFSPSPCTNTNVGVCCHPPPTITVSDGRSFFALVGQGPRYPSRSFFVTRDPIKSKPGRKPLTLQVPTSDPIEGFPSDALGSDIVTSCASSLTSILCGDETGCRVLDRRKRREKIIPVFTFEPERLSQVKEEWILSRSQGTWEAEPRRGQRLSLAASTSPPTSNTKSRAFLWCG